MPIIHPSFLDTIRIPTEQLRLYHTLRACLYVSFLAIISVVGYSFLFPSQGFSFDFRNPDAAKNTLLDPRNADGMPERKGALAQNSTLTVNSGAIGIFSNAIATVQLKKDSPLPDTLTLTAQKGYRELFLPEGTPATFPVWKKTDVSAPDSAETVHLYHIGDNTYLLQDGTLYPFVSDAAALSRYDRSDIIDETRDFLTRYPLSEERIGFRQGTLISFADGVFVVYGEMEIRPIGSALIFQAIGYHWEDVIPVSEEDMGIYERGKIILPGTLHAPGTLFHDTDTGTYFTIDNRDMRRPIIDATLLDFFLRRTHAIPVSERSRELSQSCTLFPGLLFTRSYSCDISLQDIKDIIGNDYQFTFRSPSSVGIESIDITLTRSPEKGNFRSTLSQLKVRLLDRYAR